MIESPPLPEFPAVAADEATTLRQFLDYQRIVMIRKVSGLSEEDARKPLTPGGLSILGVIKHLVDVERWWFRINFAGEEGLALASSDEDPDADFRVEDHETIAGIVAAYRDEIDKANEIASASDLRALSARAGGRSGKHISLRWIMVHMIEETARHAGHVDLIRESLDGATGD